MGSGVLVDFLDKSGVVELQVDFREDWVREHKRVEGHRSSEGVLGDIEGELVVVREDDESDRSLLVVEEDGEEDGAVGADGFASERNFEAADGVGPGEVAVVDSQGTLVVNKGKRSHSGEGVRDGLHHGK